MASESQTEKMEEKADVIPSIPPPGDIPVQRASDPPREKMIETAVKFLLNPQVRSSPLAQKKAFLQKKGVTEEEIQIAIDQSGTRQDVPKPANQTPVAPPIQGQVPMATYPGGMPQQQMVPYMQPPPPSRVQTWRDYAAIAVIISGVSFGLYKLIMRFVTPWLKSRKEEQERMARIEASLEELNKNVSGTVAAIEKSISAIETLMEKQDTQISALNAEIVSGKAVANSRRNTDTTEIKAEIMSLKGLLLSRHQFPSTPQRTQIPAWQRSNDQPSGKGNSSPPPPSSSSSSSPPSTPTPSTNTSTSASAPFLAPDPVTNGDLSSTISHAHTPVKEPIREEGEESDAAQNGANSAHNEYTSGDGSEQPINGLTTPSINGTA